MSTILPVADSRQVRSYVSACPARTAATAARAWAMPMAIPSPVNAST